MTKLILIFFLLCLASCKSNFPLDGNYKKVGADYQYSLVLNKDSTFTLNKRYFEVNASCNGKWKVNNRNEVLLECVEASLIEQLSSGYLNDRSISLQIIKNKKLKLDNVILKKIEVH
ncbi:hypothetical protein [Flavobacterium sp. UBA7663]|uniref:hypothetical protein n=1 Tax=Flavobacterium sp. UBA7663 TaxID=1946557 RepID=UPI0025BD99D2|nr:hypothetical protein [Flavobacterium sp. UBA7663]